MLKWLSYGAGHRMVVLANMHDLGCASTGSESVAGASSQDIRRRSDEEFAGTIRAGSGLQGTARVRPSGGPAGGKRYDRSGSGQERSRCTSWYGRELTDTLITPGWPTQEFGCKQRVVIVPREIRISRTYHVCLRIWFRMKLNAGWPRPAVRNDVDHGIAKYRSC